MYNYKNQNQKFKAVLFVTILINNKIFCLGNCKEGKYHNLLHVKEGAGLYENLSLNSKIYSTHSRKMCNIVEQNPKKISQLLNNRTFINKFCCIRQKFRSVHKNNDLRVNFTDFTKANKSIKLLAKNTSSAGSSTTYENSIWLMHEINRNSREYQKTRAYAAICRHIRRKKKQIKTPERSLINCTEEKPLLGFNTSWTSPTETVVVFDKIQKFSIIHEEAEYIQISLNEGVKVDKVFLWYASYTNPKIPKFECRKILGRNFTLMVSPSVNYLICLATIEVYFQINIFDCQPYKTKPLRENQPLLVKKSIPTLIILVFVLVVLAMALGATALFLLIHKNPSLIRGNKRVIEVKRQDKTQILIMPRSYENLPQTDNPFELSLPNTALEPAISTLSCDTNSTISYVSAIQPTPVEILTYRLNRLRELFQKGNSNIPSLLPSIPMSSSMSLNQRLPPNVDLLMEYEWYTITTTIITTTTTTTKEE